MLVRRYSLFSLEGLVRRWGEGKRARRDSEPAASVQSLDLLYSSSPLILPYITLLPHLLLILIPCLLSFVAVPDENWCHLTSSVSIGWRTTDQLSFIKLLLLLVLPSQTAVFLSLFEVVEFHL